ncbi:MAG: lipopolysaccharide biosynthesis protein [Fibrobacterota bacterium]
MKKEIAFYSAGNIVNRGIMFLSFFVFLRYLDKTNIAALDVFGTFTAILSTVLIFGLDSALFRFYNETGDENEKDRLLAGFTLIRFLPQIVICGALILFSPLFHRTLFPEANFRSALEAALAGLPFYLLFNHVLDVFRLRFRADLFSLFSVVNAFIYFFFAVIFGVVLDKGVGGVFIGMLLANLISSLWGLKVSKIKSVRPSFGGKFMEIVRYSLPVVASSFLFYAVNGADRWFVIHMAGAAESADYALARKIAAGPFFLFTAFQMAFTPAAHKAFGTEEYIPMIRSFSREFAVFFAVVCAFTGGISGVVVSFISGGESYSGAAGPVPVILAGFMFFCLYFFFSIEASVRKKTVYMLYSLSAGTIVNLLCNFYFVPKTGASGAAAAYLAAMAVSSVCLYAFIRPFASDFPILLFAASVCCVIVPGFLVKFAGGSLLPVSFSILISIIYSIYIIRKPRSLALMKRILNVFKR